MPTPPAGRIGTMTGPDPAVAATRVAVRRALAAHAPAGSRVLVACSGGADSLALAAAVAFEAPRCGVEAGGVTVDHGLQPGSADQARRVAETLRGLGLDPVEILPVEVAGTGPAEGPGGGPGAWLGGALGGGPGAWLGGALGGGPDAGLGGAQAVGPGVQGGALGGGLEAAARRARYPAMERLAAQAGAAWVLLGHTLDDQAETVLLGLGRGSGPRSIAGMRPADAPWLRPLLGVRRAVTTAACAAQRLAAWDDPHNTEPRFRRVRLRHEVLPLLEEVLGGGVAEALARTASQLRAELDALDRVELDLLRDRLGPPGDQVAVTVLADLPEALRRRLLRAWLRDVPGLTSAHLAAVDALLVGWHGQGPVALPRGLVVLRRHGRLLLTEAGTERPCGP
jgi:tRNA(Ile)-lysidine synthase